MSGKNDETTASTRFLPTPPKIVEALNDATGLIPAVVAPVGITLQLSTGRVSLTSDWMGVEIRDITLPTPQWTPFVAPYQIGLALPIPPIISRFVPAPIPEFRHGFYELRNTQYRNSSGVPGQSSDRSNPGAFRVDTIAPYAVATSREQPSVPVFDNAPPGTVINDAFLVNQGGLQFVFPPNTFGPQPGRFEEGDLMDVYFSPFMDLRPEYRVAQGVPMQSTGGTYFLPRDRIILSGLYYLFYTITDMAGNVSRPSFNDFRTVALLDDPEPRDPFLPLAPAPRDGSTDDLLDIEDYLQGIEGHVETYPGNAVGLDKFEWQVGAQPYGPQTSELAGFPVVFSNLNDALRAAYTATLGPQPVTMRFRIDRNGVLYLSPVKNVRVDFSVEGPALPGTLEPGSVNPALNLAQVFGADSNELNTLRISDANQPVRIEVPLWNTAAPPNDTHEVTFLWGASKERVGPFALSTLVPGENAVFSIPWSVVASHGNGMQPVSYVVTGPGTTNENPSGVTTVNVIDAVTVILPPIEILRLDGDGNWSCESLVVRMPGSKPVYDAEIFIPADPRLVVGNVVTVTITITNIHPDFPPDSFTRDFDSVPLSASDVANGFTMPIPYRPFLAQVVLGPGVLTYSTVVDTGATGHGESVEVLTVFSNPSSYCDGEEIP